MKFLSEEEFEQCKKQQSVVPWRKVPQNVIHHIVNVDDIPHRKDELWR